MNKCYVWFCLSLVPHQSFFFFKKKVYWFCSLSFFSQVHYVSASFIQIYLGLNIMYHQEKDKLKVMFVTFRTWLWWLVKNDWSFDPKSIFNLTNAKWIFLVHQKNPSSGDHLYSLLCKSVANELPVHVGAVFSVFVTSVYGHSEYMCWIKTVNICVKIPASYLGWSHVPGWHRHYWSRANGGPVLSFIFAVAH